MSLLLLIGGAAPLTVTPINVDALLIFATPDEVPTGLPVRIWVEHTDNSGGIPLTGVPQLRIFRFDQNGVRHEEINLTNMIALGAGYYYDWTPSMSANFVMTAAANHTGRRLFSSDNITARPKFDPVALALHDILVSRN